MKLLPASLSAPDKGARLWLGEERFRGAFMHSGIGMALVSSTGRFLDVNLALCRFLGFEESDLLASDFQTLTHPEDLEQDLEYLERMLKREIDTYSIEKRYRHKAGHYVWGLLTVSLVVKKDGRPRFFLSQIQDVTLQRKAAEELVRARDAAEEANQAKSNFLAMMSHEIRTPMNAVIGFTALLKATSLGPEQLDYLSIIETSGERLLSLINDVLDLAKIESGTVQVHSEPFLLRDCVEEAFELFRLAAGAKGLSYEMVFDSEIPVGIQGDRRRLVQILINVLGNAIKFTEEGGILLKVDAKPGSAGIWDWRFRISDTGPGIPAGMEEEIFQMFIQGERGATRSHGGSGLGLAISRRLADLLNGSIQVRNRPGGGAEFCLRIKAAAAEVPTKSKSPETANFQGKSVLVVEDNEINRKLCLLQLRRLGCEPAFVGSGTEAVELTGTSAFDLVLMDMQLPGLDGCAATRAIREREQGRDHVPIVAMTANAMPEDQQECLDAGMDDYLSKPLKLTTLSEVLVKWL